LSVIDLAGIGREVGVPTIAIHRAELHDALLGAVNPERVDLRMGATIEKVETVGDAVNVTFAGGGSEHFDLVVGADGIHSRTRQAIVADVPVRYSGYVCWRFIVRGVSLPEQDVAEELWGRGKRFGIVPIGDRMHYCFATINAPGGRKSMEHVDRDAFVDLFAEFGGNVPRILRALGRDHQLILDDISDMPMAVWSQGPAVLLGDAAHATTPNLGQGAAMAIEDAMVLAGTLSRASTVAEALAQYRNARHERVTQITERSYSLGRIAQTESAPAIFLRNLALRLTPDRVAQRNNVRLVLAAPDPKVYAA
jgi:2-polyprenyl-6-methoxyphenol hydroxylase-like FAD-dependent oxidoreductase